MEIVFYFIESNRLKQMVSSEETAKSKEKRLEEKEKVDDKYSRTKTNYSKKMEAS